MYRWLVEQVHLCNILPDDSLHLYGAWLSRQKYYGTIKKNKQLMRGSN